MPAEPRRAMPEMAAPVHSLPADPDPYLPLRFSPCPASPAIPLQSAPARADPFLACPSTPYRADPIRAEPALLRWRLIHETLPQADDSLQQRLDLGLSFKRRRQFARAAQHVGHAPELCHQDLARHVGIGADASYADITLFARFC